MAVRRLKAKQRGPWCSYCDEKVRAVHRGLGFTKFSCSAHLQDLEEADRKYEAMSSYKTEAEWSLGL